MSFIMSYTDPAGTVHANSYWVAGSISYNPITKIGQVIFQGYHDKDSFDAGDGQLAGSPHPVATTDPAIFYQFFGNARRIFSGLSFEEWLDSFAQDQDLFFGLATLYANVDVIIVDIGLLNTSTLSVAFGDDITSQGGDYNLGVTVRVNGTPVTPSVAAKQTGTFSIWYTIPAVDIDDVVDWEYDGLVGDLADNGGQILQSIDRLTAGNSIGSYRWFNRLEDSGWIATI